MERILIQYKDDSIKRLEKIEKGDWIDLYAAEDTYVSSIANKGRCYPNPSWNRNEVARWV